MNTKNLEIVENGSFRSLVDESGHVYGTAHGLSAMLYEAAWNAGREGCDKLLVNGCLYDVEEIAQPNEGWKEKFAAARQERI